VTAKSIPVVTDAKCVIVVQDSMSLGLIANTAAVIALTLGARVDIIGPDLNDASSEPHAGLTTIPVPVLKAGAETVAALRAKAAQRDDVFVVDVTDAAQTTTNYDDYREKLEVKASTELEYLGIGMYGDRRAINRLTGSLPLVR
jgi:hypothetical protein